MYSLFFRITLKTVEGWRKNERARRPATGTRCRARARSARPARQRVRDVELPMGEGALVVADVPAVQPHVAEVVDALRTRARRGPSPCPAVAKRAGVEPLVVVERRQLGHVEPGILERRAAAAGCPGTVTVPRRRPTERRRPRRPVVAQGRAVQPPRADRASGRSSHASLLGPRRPRSRRRAQPLSAPAERPCT